MATLATQFLNRAGLTETLVAAAGGGDACDANSNALLKVVNGGGSPITVTLAIPSAASPIPNVTYTNVQVSVTNGSHKWIKVGPEMKDPTTGLCTITYSAVTSVTVGAFTITDP